MRQRLLVASFAAAAALQAIGQEVGPEFQVNEQTVSYQQKAHVGFDSSGDFVVQWTSDQDGARGIYARRYAASGLPITDEFRVNTSTVGVSYGDVAVTPAGDFVVVWYAVPNGGPYGVFGQRYSASGAPLGNVFTVATTASAVYAYVNPRVSASPTGSFVVVWDAFVPGGGKAVGARRYASSGAPLGSAFRVNTQTIAFGSHPHVAVDAHSGFVVTWDSTNVTGNVLARRYSSSGTALTGEFRVNAVTNGVSYNPAVAFGSDGTFLVVWTELHEIVGTRFSSSGAPVGGEFRVDSSTLQAYLPEIAPGPAGSFLVAWERVGAGVDRQIVGRFLGPGLAPVAPEFIVAAGTSFRRNAAVGSDGTGRFAVVYESQYQDGDVLGIFGRRYDFPPVPVTDEFRVNTSTTLLQSYPKVSEDSNGDFVVVWATSDGNAIIGKRFSNGGAPLGADFRVNNSTAILTASPNVAVAPSGAFTIAWTAGGSEDGSNFGVYAKRYASTGAALTSEFRVNTYTTAGQLAPVLAADGLGDVIVAWTSAGQDGDGFGVFGQRFGPTGAALGPELPISDIALGNQTAGGVAADAQGGFVVVWTSNFGFDDDVYARRYDGTGEPVGASFAVNAAVGGDQNSPSVAMDAAGNFVVAWKTSDGSGTGIAARRFSTSASSLGTEFTVNTYTTGDQGNPAVAMESDGDFIVTWQSPRDGGGLGIYGQRFKRTGERIGTEFPINTHTTNDQSFPAIALGRTWVSAWQSYAQDGDQTGIYARLFQPPCRPGDANGDESVDVADVFFLVNYLFAGGSAPPCGGDVNGSGTADVSDVFYLINYLFAGGPPPV